MKGFLSSDGCHRNPAHTHRLWLPVRLSASHIRSGSEQKPAHQNRACPSPCTSSYQLVAWSLHPTPQTRWGGEGRVMLPLLDAVPSWMNETKHEISPNSLIRKCKLKYVPLGYSFQCLLTLYCGNFVSCRFPETTLYWYKNIQMNLYFSTRYKRSAITELPFVNAFPMPDPAK